MFSSDLFNVPFAISLLLVCLYGQSPTPHAFSCLSPPWLLITFTSCVSLFLCVFILSDSLTSHAYVSWCESICPLKTFQITLWERERTNTCAYWDFWLTSLYCLRQDCHWLASTPQAFELGSSSLYGKHSMNWAISSVVSGFPLFLRFWRCRLLLTCVLGSVHSASPTSSDFSAFLSVVFFPPSSVGAVGDV